MGRRLTEEEIMKRASLIREEDRLWVERTIAKALAKAKASPPEIPDYWPKHFWVVAECVPGTTFPVGFFGPYPTKNSIRSEPSETFGRLRRIRGKNCRTVFYELCLGQVSDFEKALKAKG